MMIDVFNNDAFKVMALTTMVNRIPFAQTRLRRLGWFREAGVRSLIVGIEMLDGVLKLVPDQPRGAPGVLKNPERSKLEYIRTAHLPQRIHVMADEIQGLRAAGSETEVVTMSKYVEGKMAVPRGDLDQTHEFHRIGAVKGVVMDADGTTPLVNLFTKFGVTQQTHDMDLDDTTSDFQTNVLAAKRKSEAKLGMYRARSWRALCGEAYFDAMLKRADFKAAYDRYNESSVLRDDPREGFSFGKVYWEEYTNVAGVAEFIEPDCAYLVPEGIPGLFETWFAPANYMDTVNTEGVPYYSSIEVMDHNIGVEIQMQSNPLHLCTRPNAIIKLGQNAAALA